MNHHEHIYSKILTLDELTERLGVMRQGQQKPVVVFTNGCFDLVHRGHVDYLSRARDLGDLLVVGLNSDSSVRRLKGESRPVSNESSRAAVLAAMEFICPDILVKGGDYDRSNVVGADFVEAHGGRLELLSLVPGESTTRLVERIKQ